MRKEPMPMSSKYNFSATSSLKMWFTLPKLLIFFFVFTIFSLNSISSSATPDKLSYADHCASSVPESIPIRYASFDPSVLSHTGYYSGGGGGSGSGIRSPKQSYQPNYEPSYPVEFNVWSIEQTDVRDLFEVRHGSLQFQRDTDHMGSLTNRLPQSPMRFALNGFWSQSSGKLCMVGSGSIYSKQGNLLSDAPALLKLHNLMNFSSVTSLISGTLESLMISQKDPNYFEPISILMFPRMNYQYTLVSDKSNDNSSSSESDAPKDSLQMEKICSVISVVPEYYLQYSNHCLPAMNCTAPLFGSGLFPSIVALRGIECSEDNRRLRVLIEFADQRKHSYKMTFNPNTTLVGEGSWDVNRTQLQVVACHFLDVRSSFNNSHTGDCSTRLSLTFPGIWTIRDTRNAAGHIWSNKAVAESGYFEKIAFGSLMNYDGGVQCAGQKYEYTQIEKVTKLCPREKSAAATDYKTKVYPNPFLYDMRFHMFSKRSKSVVDRGRSYPLSVGNRLYKYGTFIEDAYSLAYTHRGPYNISFFIFINVSNMSNANVISAEGVYDDTDGSMCMVGCQNLGQIDQQPTDDSVDCEILLTLQLPPATPGRKISGYVKGSIESLRKKSDPLHFQRLDLSSDDMFMAEADRSIRRLEVETTLVLMSTTLAYVFGALQLFHMNKRPDVLPSISILMLLVLTLGYLKPLIYYFEAIFTYSTDYQDVFIGSDGWLQVDQANLMAITVMIMLAFLLHFHLLQQTWSARSAKGTLKDLWDAEKKAVSVSVVGFFVAMALLMNSSHQEHPILDLSSYGAYAGLVLDGFLFPQIVLNMVCKSKDKALSVGFYIGTTFVQILPHAYDFYRTGSSDLVLEEPYVFATPVAGFYSTAWDIIIPMGALLFSVIIFLQQKFGGRCFLPQKLRELGDKKVPKSF